ncbi:MFS transporter [Kitasatospora sp. NPDC085879]|uniref:MFS transporter n=1 Tax=Kitasatospora sp. NPDC085879 TaxID=3154769 RepID=UPI00343DDE9C
MGRSTSACSPACSRPTRSAARCCRRRRGPASRRSLYACCLLVSGGPRMLVAAFAPGLLPLGITLAVAGVAAGILNPIVSTVLYELVPVTLRSRVTGVLAAGVLLATPLGDPLGGLACGCLVDRAGLATALVLLGGAYLLITLCPLVFPAWRRMDSTATPRHVRRSWPGRLRREKRRSDGAAVVRSMGRGVGLPVVGARGVVPVGVVTRRDAARAALRWWRSVPGRRLVGMGAKKKTKWAPAVVHCRPGSVAGVETAAAHVSGRVRVTGRWVRVRTGGGAEMWIAAGSVQRIVWDETPGG